jgi:hypothetical protein
MTAPSSSVWCPEVVPATAKAELEGRLALFAANRLLEAQLHQRTMYEREMLAVIARDGDATVATLAARLGGPERIDSLLYGLERIPEQTLRRP